MLKIIPTNAKKIYNYMHTANDKNQYNIYTQYRRKYTIRDKQQIRMKIYN